MELSLGNGVSGLVAKMSGITRSRIVCCVTDGTKTKTQLLSELPGEEMGDKVDTEKQTESRSTMQKLGGTQG